MENKITVEGKEFIIKDILYVDALEYEGLDKKDAAKKMILLGSNVTEETIKTLTLKESVVIQKAIIKQNGLQETQDFQIPTEEKTK